MSAQEFNGLHIVHISAVLLLVGTVFYACAGAPETKRAASIWGGIAALIVLLTGIRMWQAQFSFAILGWVLVKILCWLGISAFIGLSYRKREKAGLFLALTVILGAIAVAMAYAKPF